MQIDLLLGVISFSGIVLALVAVIIAARSKLVSTGNVSIEINGDSSNPIVVPAGSKLLQTLAENKIFLSSACGGGGTCSQCKCVVLDGGGSILPTEESHFNSREKNEGWRLSCQVPVKSDMKIEVPEEIFGVKEWECEVLSNDNVATFIKELVLKLPEGKMLILELVVMFNLKHLLMKLTINLLIYKKSIMVIGINLKFGIINPLILNQL